MKRFLPALLFAGLLPQAALAADAAVDCPVTTEAENEALARSWHEDVINRRKPEALAGILSDKLVHHASGGYPATMDVAGVGRMMDDFLKAFPDLNYTFDLMVARGEFVIERYTATGTLQGQLGDIAANGRKATWSGINIFRIECGRIAEVWSEVDAAGRRKQLAGP